MAITRAQFVAIVALGETENGSLIVELEELEDLVKEAGPKRMGHKRATAALQALIGECSTDADTGVLSCPASFLETHEFPTGAVSDSNYWSPARPAGRAARDLGFVGRASVGFDGVSFTLTPMDADEVTAWHADERSAIGAAAAEAAAAEAAAAEESVDSAADDADEDSSDGSEE